MKNLICVLLAIGLLAVATPASAQCNSANGQCNAPQGLSLNAQQQLAFLQQSAATSASSSATAPAAPVAQFAAPAFSYQYAAPAYQYAAQAYSVQPSQVFLMLPQGNPAFAGPAPEDVAVSNPPRIPVQAGQFYSLIGLAGAPTAASAGGASVAASASSAAPAFVSPVPVNPGLVQASSGCASGNCNSRGGLLSRLGSRGGLLGKRSSSRSVSISRTRVR